MHAITSKSTLNFIGGLVDNISSVSGMHFAMTARSMTYWYSMVPSLILKTNQASCINQNLLSSATALNLGAAKLDAIFGS